MKVCEVWKCGKPHHAKGWCNNHYAKRRTRICTVKECNEPLRAKGFCGTHYQRYRRWGDPLKVQPSVGPSKAEGSVRMTLDGYRVVKHSTHPQADKWGWVREHRKVMWDEFGKGPHPCWGCGEPLTWQRWIRSGPKKGVLIVNHLNEIKADNSLTNLVFSCNRCNRDYSRMIRLMEHFGIEHEPH